MDARSAAPHGGGWTLWRPSGRLLLVPVSRPITVIEELARELGPRLVDLSIVMPRDELRSLLADLRRAQRDAPAEQLGTVFLLLGHVYSRLGDPANALDAHRNARHYEPAAASHPTNVAMALINLGRFRQALVAIREALAKPLKPPDLEVTSLLNAAEAHHGLGEVNESRRAFADALRHLDQEKRPLLFQVASQAAIIGLDDDAVEFFARYVAFVQGVERGEIPAVEIIRAAPSEIKEPLASAPLLAAAIERVTARWDAPMPDEHQLQAEINLSSEAWATVMDLIEHPPAPTEPLRQLLHVARS
jgi:tetratricopeptide (TPR) repeat protein